MKKAPMGKYQRSNKQKPILATMTEESRLRRTAWLRHGCNAFEGSKQSSNPMSFWTEQDVLNYIRIFHLDIAPVYGNIITCNADGDPVLPLGNVGYFTESGAWVDGLNGCRHHCSMCQRTGCVFCGFGAHLDKTPTRFQLLKEFHPKLYDYCMRGGQWIDNPDYDPSDHGEPDDLGWINWNPKQIWIPGNGGLGMKYVFDFCNNIYGKDFIRYE